MLLDVEKVSVKCLALQKYLQEMMTLIGQKSFFAMTNSLFHFL